MIQTDNNYPNTARIFTADFTGNADMPARHRVQRLCHEIVIGFFFG